MRKPNPIPGNKPFKKGRSGNPNGRPRKIPELDQLLADVLGERDPKGIAAAEQILKALLRRARAGDVRAAEVLLDRAYGKPKQAMDLTTNGKAMGSKVIDPAMPD